MSYKNSVLARNTEHRLEQIHALLRDLREHPLT
jgi:hypothetical protein